MNKGTEKENKNTNSFAIVDLLRYTYRFAEGKRGWMFLFILLFILSNIFAQLFIALGGKIFNYIQINGVNSNNIYTLSFMVSGFFFLGIIFWILHGPARVIENKIAFYVSNKFRDYLYKNTLELPLLFHNTEHSGQIISKINKGVTSLDSFSSSMFILIRSFCSMFGVVVALAIFDYKYALASMLMLAMVYYINSFFEKNINPLRDNINKIDNIISEIVYDTISNITTIKMLSLSGLVHKSLDKQVKDKYKVFKKKIVLNQIKWFMPSLFGNMLITGVLFYYIFSSYLSNTVILVGSLYVLYEYLTRLVWVFNDIAWLMSDLQDNARNLRNSEYLSDQFSEIKKIEYKQIEKINNLEIRDLNFKYNEAFDLHIDELKFEKGKSYALVGESGCGKTTTMKILASLIDVDEYTLIINSSLSKEIGATQGLSPSLPSREGANANANAFVFTPPLVEGVGGRPVSGDKSVDGRPVRLENIREATMLIPQEPELFSNTVRENITLGLPFMESEIDEVLDIVNMKDTIANLPDGRESKIFEKGVNLSGGQKQRLALARGLLFAKDKEMILLDEPTSSVDQDNEERIYEALIKMSHEKILISSVHKKNLLKYFDYVIHFEKGKIIKVEKRV